MSRDGEFEEYLEDHELSTEDIDRIRLERGREAVASAHNRLNKPRSGGNLFGFSEDEAALLAAGSESLDETERRLREGSGLSIKGRVEDLFQFRGDYDSELFGVIDEAVNRGDLKAVSGTNNELDVIASRAFDGAE